MENKDSYKRIERRLYSYKVNITRVKILDDEIQKELNNFHSVGAMTYEERITSSNKVNSSVENEVIRREEKIKRLQQEKNRIECDIRQIENVLEFLSDDERKLIVERYFKKKTYLQLTNVFPYSHTGILLKVRKIIKKIYELYGGL